MFLLYDIRLMNLHKLILLRPRWNGFFNVSPHNENSVAQNMIK